MQIMPATGSIMTNWDSTSPITPRRPLRASSTWSWAVIIWHNNSSILTEDAYVALAAYNDSQAMPCSERLSGDDPDLRMSSIRYLSRVLVRRIAEIISVMPVCRLPIRNLPHPHCLTAKRRKRLRKVLYSTLLNISGLPHRIIPELTFGPGYWIYYRGIAGAMSFRLYAEDLPDDRL